MRNIISTYFIDHFYLRLSADLS